MWLNSDSRSPFINDWRPGVPRLAANSFGCWRLSPRRSQWPFAQRKSRSLASLGTTILLRRGTCLFPLLLMVAACNKPAEPDAYGNFEAQEVVVSAQATGQLKWFTPVEGTKLASGTIVGVVDTTQLDLERAQTVAQRAATEARVVAASGQVGVYESQLAVTRRTLDRTRRLFDQKAATAQQLDQAERDYRTLVAQIGAAQAQRQSVAKEVAATNAQVAQIHDRISKSEVANPQAGTVLATYVKAGEVVQPGQALYRIANLDTLILRAYVVEKQLASLKLGQRVLVHVDQNGTLLTLPGVVTWVAAKAEFTPTPVQTRDERADLVYAVKVNVANTNGALKIGMPADVSLTGAPRGT
jgi:HlyD family secretion protein